MDDGKTVIILEDHRITVRRTENQQDYVSLTDIARHKSNNPTAVIQSWMRNYGTIEFLAYWEQHFNKKFNPSEIDAFLSEAGSNSFTMSPQKWIKSTNAIGIESQPGRYGGTYAHADIAMELMSWISPKFRFAFRMEYNELKQREMQRQFPARDNSKMSLLPGNSMEPIFTEPPKIMEWKAEYEELCEADIINMALFGITQAEFERQYPVARGEVHNNSAISHVVTHESLRRESLALLNAHTTKQERFEALNRLAVEQATSRLDKDRLLETAQSCPL